MSQEWEFFYAETRGGGVVEVRQHLDNMAHQGWELVSGATAWRGQQDRDVIYPTGGDAG